MSESKAVEIGHFEKKQVLCRSNVIAWSHRSRFELARRLVEPYSGGRLLDYGCGDGTFLKGIYDLFPVAVGVDRAEDQVLDCRSRFDQTKSLSFASIEELHQSYEKESFDVITCMEVLEHCVAEEAEKVLNDLVAYVRSGGPVIISVPIEIGPSLILKQSFRRLAALRNLGDYKWMEKYSLKELCRMVLATSSTSIVRPEYGESEKFHGHKGFNWRALEKMIARHLRVEKRFFTPLGLFRGYLSSQVWFICYTR